MALPEPIEIARLEENREAVAVGEIALESEPLAGGVMAFTPPGTWSNQACGIGLSGPVSERELNRLVDYYVSRGVEPRIELAPFADESVIKGLAERCFTVREFVNVFARALPPGEDLRALLPFGWPEGLRMQWIDPTDEALVHKYAVVSGSGFRKPGEEITAELLGLTVRATTHPRSDSFLARIGAEPVGGGGLETTGPDNARRIACLFGASVYPGFRRRGIQQALIVRRMEMARERGAEFVCILSRPGIPTERNAARLGFQLAYTKAVLAMAGPGLIPSP